jgi:hypothetical protein
VVGETEKHAQYSSSVEIELGAKVRLADFSTSGAVSFNEYRILRPCVFGAATLPKTLMGFETAIAARRRANLIVVRPRLVHLEKERPYL